MSMKKINGFTLVELMITVAIAGIFAMAAAPSFTKMIQNNRLATQSNTLIGALNLARSESIKRGFNVILCRSSNGATCAVAGDWDQGWIVFVDTNNDVAPQAAEILRIYGDLAGRGTLKPNGLYTDRVVYQSNGFTTQVGTFVLCEDIDGDGDIKDGPDFRDGRAIIINRTGRARSDDATNSTFADCEGP